MENKTINIGVVAEVAQALGDLKEDMVFVGGAIISLYTDDPAADEIRPTQDVDMTLNVLNLSHWNKLQEQLADRGFHPDPFGTTVCSYKLKDIPVDIMSSDDGHFGPSNRWYKIGFEDLQNVVVKDQLIRILSAPCYLATKFEAFNSRGSDYRTSHDIEDIINILDNRTTIVREIRTTDQRIKAFIQEQIIALKNKGMMEETLLAHIHPFMREERIPMIEEKIIKILKD